MDAANGFQTLSDNELDYEYVTRKSKKNKNRKLKKASTNLLLDETNGENSNPYEDEDSNEVIEESEDNTTQPEATESVTDAVRYSNEATIEAENELIDGKPNRYEFIIIPDRTFFTSSTGNAVDLSNREVRNLETRTSSVQANKKALSREAKSYELENFHLKLLIIFNQENIDGFEPRYGTKEDVSVLIETFTRYGFDIIEYKDLNRDEITEVLETFKTANFTDYGCIALAVLTHGSYNDLLRAKDQAYSETEIVNYFNIYINPTLVSKPKLLFIQACRGTSTLPGVSVIPQSGRIREDLNDDDIEFYTLPIMSDLLIVHSSYVGEPSTRDELHGTWFIQTLCNKIKELADSEDLLSILTEVKREVAANLQWVMYNRRTRVIDTYKQMPTVTSTLIRRLFLRDFNVMVPISYLDHSAAGPSRPTMDTAAPPLLIQFGPCDCFLSHFNYIRKCLVHFLEKCPDDSAARTFLQISSTFQDDGTFNAAKLQMAKAVCRYFDKNARDFNFFKYLYLLNDISE